MTNRSVKSKNIENIDFIIRVGEYPLCLSLPRHTKVGGLIAIVKDYEDLHYEYGPIGQPFIGLGANGLNPLLDYWLTQHDYDFTRFSGTIELKAVYSYERSNERLSPNEW